jgi:hypothetical protein
LDAKVRTLQARIEAPTGKSWWYAQEDLEDGVYAGDRELESKLKSYLLRLNRASERLEDLCERGIFDKLELSKRAHLKHCAIVMKDAYYIDNEYRCYSPWTYLRAIERARELGCDGVIIKNTYDMGTPSHYASQDDDDITDVYIVFDADQVQTAQTG